jgi:hypothetical protein
MKVPSCRSGLAPASPEVSAEPGAVHGGAVRSVIGAVDDDEKVKDASAGGAVDGVGDGRGGPVMPISRPGYAQRRGGGRVVETAAVDGRNVSVDGQVVSGQTGAAEAVAARSLR